MTKQGSEDQTEGRAQLESTESLLSLVRAGDEAARDRLLERYLPILRRWAHGRLPGGARDLLDTDDLVQVTLLRALSHMEAFESQREGAFLAYLRSIVLNAIRDEIRRVARRPRSEALEMDLPADAPSHLERAIGREAVQAYEEALASLPEEQQEAVIMRIEFGYSYPEIAEALNRPSSNAARMTVSRALVRLAEVMGNRHD